jgi:hypothetical protein
MSLAAQLLIDILGGSKEASLTVTEQEVLEAYRARVEVAGLVRVPTGGRAVKVLNAAGIFLHRGPIDVVSGGNLLFGKLAPLWAVALYQSWAVRSASIEYTEERITNLILLLRSDKLAQDQVDAVARLSGKEGVYSWAR